MKKEHFIDVFILVNQLGEIIFRMRDDGEPFNPFSFLENEEYELEDPYEHIGIRMINKLVNNSDYRFSLGMNNLLLRI